jgi:protein TonB
MPNSIAQRALPVIIDASPRHVRGAVSAPLLAGIVIAIALLAGGVWWYLQQSGGLPTALAPTPAPDAADGVADAPEAEVAQDLTVEQLYKEARKAMSENRMVAPAGNNALEFYQRILAKQPDDTGATDALRELFPFATGSAEEKINQGNFDEASRIMGLLAKADPSNYTLTILRSKLDAKKKQAERELAQQAQQAATAATAATRTPASAAADAGAASGTPAAAAPAEAPASAPAPKPAEIASAAPAPSAAPPPVAEPVGETRDARVVVPPRPTYPPAAARNRQDGWVEVEFTVAVDGSVQNAKVLSSNPPRVFDREALVAIQQAKFEARLDRGQPVASTLRRRIEFKLSN